MDKRMQEAIDRILADWPPLTEETKEKLRALLHDSAVTERTPDDNPAASPDEAKQGWIERQLASMPGRSQEWKDETLRLWRLRQAPPPGLTLRAPITCPGCGTVFQGVWDLSEGETPGIPKDQQCPQGHTFSATWPDWPLKPQIVIRRASPDEEKKE